MQITITARHFDLTKAIRDYVEEATSRLEKYFDHIINVHFILSLDNNQNNVEMILHIPRNNMKSEASEKDMYLAIDTALDRMETQIKKLKGRWTDHHKKSVKESAHFVYANQIEGEFRKTVKTKRIIAELMTVNEALDKFDELKESYLIFKNVATDRINVLVRKDKQNYKLLEP
ncbi:MAG: ribosome-associated translation inhibitor RaiA [Candidatus Cloacimonetes bacterium]|nr:ribosome-associated translation inhibitor RaiA [Candidatus Cloacimonadota bacterium]